MGALKLKLSEELSFSAFVIFLIFLQINFPCALSDPIPSGSCLLPESEVDVLNDILEKAGETSKGHSYDRRSCRNITKPDAKVSILCNCYGTSCHVTSIDSSGIRLTGFIPPALDSLSYLINLDLSDNLLSGSIPASLGKLSLLKTLDISGNHLVGNIPEELGALSQLEALYLSDNFLTGPVPKNLSTLQSLYYLYLGGNLLDGSIPASFGDFTSLLYLSLWANCFTGKVPKELGNITTLKNLELDDNFLSGKLPPHIGNLSRLHIIYLGSNNFIGEIPESFRNLKNLTTFDVRGTQLSGKIPGYIAEWRFLQQLFFYGSNFAGPIPSNISRLKYLQILEIGDLAGSERASEGFSFPDLSRMTGMARLTLRNCSIKDHIPPYIGKNMPYLKYIDLSFNQLYGGVPLNLTGPLRNIYLSYNKLNGSISSQLITSKDMKVDLSFNDILYVANFTSPNDVSPTVSLFACCSPSEKKLKDEWLNTVLQCPQKKPNNTHLFINCGGKKMNINGSQYEPDEHHPRPGTSYYLSPKGNWAYVSTGDYSPSSAVPSVMLKSRTCEEPDEALYSTARLSPISLKYYGLCLQNGNYTVKLHFAELLFTINTDNQRLGKRFFDVIIQGQVKRTNFDIKSEAKGSNKRINRSFSGIQVNNHTLDIHLYWTGKGSTDLPADLYGPLISAIAVTPEFETGDKKKLSIAVKAGIAVGSAFVLFIFILIFLWKVGFLCSKEEGLGLELYPGGFFSFQQIKSATQNFSSANKIGEGGFGAVYKGILPNGTAIAVKQLSSRSKQGTQEFVNEVGTISALQHQNLVRLLGCCTQNNQLLLVYEYMENNCLARCLFGSEDEKLRLDWQTRHKICLGIAKGLAFLHEESRLKIIHRDIKATNILLDKDLNGKISDFGLAKLHEGEDTEIVTRIAGTLGYMAPEYATRGHLTTKADVYSFGVLMLEILSGRSNTSYERNEEEYVYLLDKAYILQKIENLLELVDPILLESECPLEEAKRMLNVAMLCTNPSPALRPSMSTVVSILEGKTSVDAASFHPMFPDHDSVKSHVKIMADPSFSEATVSTFWEGTDTVGGKGRDEEKDTMSSTKSNTSSSYISTEHPQGSCRHTC
ncbi:hypothetical protein H6P81_014286 [Aristolochia fimbriata]|uniref:non-specific serine/threonine protein kinase n=1 Tax=Aristolochia fimbriata TaxID=158543 RepID=A0AAV7ELN6_ARIFI|nr:hypothetical protein H6P81_014286 [Aristolochia fimbriata]